MRRLRLVALALFLLGVCTQAWAIEVGLLHVDTPSVPMGYYRSYALQERPLERGTYVCFEPSSPAIPKALRVALAAEGTATVVKQVGGVAGDRISYDHDQVLINDVPVPNSTWLSQDSQGRPLPRASLPRVLQPGEVWLTSVHPRGFDSRYFGPLRTSALSCVAQLVWAS